MTTRSLTLAVGLSKILTRVRCTLSLGYYNFAATAQQYLSGLMQAEKRNMEGVAEAVPGSDKLPVALAESIIRGLQYAINSFLMLSCDYICSISKCTLSDKRLS